MLRRPTGQPDQNCRPCLLAIIDYRSYFGEIDVANLTNNAMDSGKIPSLQILIRLSRMWLPSSDLAQTQARGRKSMVDGHANSDWRTH